MCAAIERLTCPGSAFYNRCMLVEMEVTGLTVDPGNNTPIVVLKEKSGERILPIWIGVVEASAIACELEKLKLNRPMTHDLLKNTVESLGGSIERVSVVGLRENTYYALVVVTQNGRTIEIDSRPSDAIAIALRARAPILCEDAVIEESQDNEVVLVEDEPQEPRVVSNKEAATKAVEPPPRPRRRGKASEPVIEGPRPIMGADANDLVELLERLEPEDFGKYKM